MSESENEIDKNIFLISDTLLSPEDIAMHLTRFDPNVNRYTDSLTDSFPNGSQVYLVHKPNPKNDEKEFYTDDRMKWFNDGSNKQHGPAWLNLTKSYFTATTIVNNEMRKQKDKTFSKVIYKIKDQVSPVMVHYLGDNSKFIAPKHGNSTVSDKPYRRTSQKSKDYIFDNIRSQNPHVV